MDALRVVCYDLSVSLFPQHAVYVEHDTEKNTFPPQLDDDEVLIEKATILWP